MSSTPGPRTRAATRPFGPRPHLTRGLGITELFIEMCNYGVIYLNVGLYKLELLLFCDEIVYFTSNCKQIFHKSVSLSVVKLQGCQQSKLFRNSLLVTCRSSTQT